MHDDGVLRKNEVCNEAGASHCNENDIHAAWDSLQSPFLFYFARLRIEQRVLSLTLFVLASKSFLVFL